MRVLPDETGLGKTFDYLVPPGWEGQVEVGTRVRIALGPRRVGAWVVETAVAPPAGVELKPLAKISGHGPAAELLDLAEWARWRWAAKTPVPFLRTASPERNVVALPARPSRAAPAPAVADPVVGPAAADALAGGPTVLRLPPTADLAAVAQAAAGVGDALVICPSHRLARHVAARLRRAGVAVALHPDEWARAAAGGCTVVGTRAAAWAPAPDLAAVVVLDEPTAGAYYGGEIAAPVYAAVMSGALRLLAIPPDDLQRLPATTLVQAKDPW